MQEEARVQAENEVRQARMYAYKEQRRLQEEEKEKARLETFACRRCPAKFPSNTKLHTHVQKHHTKKASEHTPEPPTLSLSTITTIDTPPSTPTVNTVPTPPATPKKAALPVALPPTPPATPPITYATVASKASPPTKPPTSPSTPRKPYLTVDDLYQMFHNTRKAPQSRLTDYFKPVGKSLGNGLPTTKYTPSSLASRDCGNIDNIALRAPKFLASKRYISELPLKIAPEKASETRPVPPHSCTSSTYSTSPSSTYTPTCRRCHLTCASNNKLHKHLCGCLPQRRSDIVWRSKS